MNYKKDPAEFLVGDEQFRFKKYSPSIIQSFKKKWVHYNLHLHREEYLIPYQCEIYCFTWNNAGKYDSFSLKVFLDHILKKTTESLQNDNSTPKIFFITFQEITDLSAKGFLYQKIGFDESVKVIEESLKSIMSKFGLKQLNCGSLFGLYCAVFASESIHRDADCLSENLSLGMMRGYIANKGAIGFSLNLYESNVCFVGCHLSAHFMGLQKRNSDLLSIEQKLLFKRHCPRLEDFDVVFIAGDLNYRLEPSDTETLSASLKSKNYNWLTSHDQLIKEMSDNNILKGYTEAPISFLPTYKFKPNSSVYVYERFKADIEKRFLYYNNKISGKMPSPDPSDAKLFSKIPSYTDRILYKATHTNLSTEDSLKAHKKSFVNTTLACVEYDSLQAPTKSDHRPVYGVFKACLQQREKNVYSKIKADLNSVIERWENEQIPKTKLASSYINFKDTVSYNVLSTVESLIITNPTFFIVEVVMMPLLSLNLSNRWSKALKNEVILFKHKKASLTPLKASKLELRAIINSYNVFTIHKTALEKIQKESKNLEKEEALSLFSSSEDKNEENKQIYSKDLVIEVSTDYSVKATYGAASFVCFSFKYELGLLGAPLEYLAFRRGIKYNSIAPDVPPEIKFLCDKISIGLRSHNNYFVPSLNKNLEKMRKVLEISKEMGKSDLNNFESLVGSDLEIMCGILFYVLTGITRPVLKIKVAEEVGIMIEKYKTAKLAQGDLGMEGMSVNGLDETFKSRVVEHLRKRLKPLYFNTFYAVVRCFGNLRSLTGECMEYLEECLVKKGTYKISSKEGQMAKEGIKGLIYIHK